MRRVVVDAYECEICGVFYETPEQASACEGAGRPAPGFQKGQHVAFRPEVAPDALRDERFTVEESMITLADPAWAVCEGDSGQPRHVVSYVLQNHLGRVAFIPEEQLTRS